MPLSFVQIISQNMGLVHGSSGSFRNPFALLVGSEKSAVTSDRFAFMIRLLGGWHSLAIKMEDISLFVVNLENSRREEEGVIKSQV